MKYQVIVGNIGQVWEGVNPIRANGVYGHYRKMSKANIGRAGGEDVTILTDGEPTTEYFGSINLPEMDDE